MCGNPCADFPFGQWSPEPASANGFDGTLYPEEPPPKKGFPRQSYVPAKAPCGKATHLKKSLPQRGFSLGEAAGVINH